jgi:ATP-dependent protease ClpP protease subunit
MDKYGDYINKIEGNTVELALRGDIVDRGETNHQQMNGYMLAEAIGFFGNQGKEIKLNINSPGGGFLSTLPVVHAVEKHSVNTHVEGLAASSAGVIAMSGAERTMNDFAQLMVHSVHVGSGKKPTVSQQEALSALNGTLSTIITNRSNREPEQVSEMLSKDTWIKASEAKSYDMIDKVLTTGKRQLEVTNSLHEMYLNACKITNVKTEKEKEMDENLLKEKADLQAKYDVLQNRMESVDSKYDTLLETETTLKAENKALTEEKEELQKELNASKEAEANAFLNSKSVKLEGKTLEMFINMYEQDKEAAIGFIAAMPVSAPTNLANFTNKGGESTGETLIHGKNLEFWNSEEGEAEIGKLYDNGEEAKALEIENKLTPENF